MLGASLPTNNYKQTIALGTAERMQYTIVFDHCELLSRLNYLLHELLRQKATIAAQTSHFRPQNVLLIVCLLPL